MERSLLIRAGYNLILLQEAEKIFSLLSLNGIPVILLKGLALAETVYEHAGERQFSDIDFLLKKRDIPLAQDIISGSGYQVMEGSKPLYTKRSSLPVNLHLHRDIPYAEEEEIWDNLKNIRINNTEVYILPPEENLLYLIYHLAISHGHPREKWIKDIDRVVRHYEKEIDWLKLINKAKAYGLTIPSYYTFLKTKELFHTPVPDFVIHRLKPKRNSLRSGICRLVFLKESSVYFAGYLLKALFFPRMIFSSLFPSRDFLKRRYKSSSPLIFFYYILRPLSLLFKGMLAVKEVVLRKLQEYIRLTILLT